MDKQRLESALMRTMTEVIASDSPEDMKKRFNDVYDIDIWAVFELVHRIINDCIDKALQMEVVVEEIESYDDIEDQKAASVRIILNLASQRSFFAGYFLAEEQFSNESIRN